MNRRDCELRFDGFRYFYRVYPNPAGRIEPIVLLTGAFQTLDAWTKLAGYVNRTAPVIVVDLPGLGTADPLPARYGVDFLASALLKVMEAERVPRANLAAPSYSVPAAYRFAQSRPDIVNRLVLVGTMKEMPLHYVRPLEQSILLLREGRMDAFEAMMLQRLSADERLTEKGALVKRVLRSAVRNFSAENRRRYEQNAIRLLSHSGLDLTAGPGMPTLIFAGEHDNLTKPGYGREVAAALPDAAFTTIRRADHLCHLHQFSTCARLISDFFSGRSLESVRACSPMEYFGRAADAAVPGQIPGVDGLAAHGVPA